MDQTLAQPITPSNNGWRCWLVPFIAVLLTGLLLLEGDSCGQYELDHFGDKVPKKGIGRMPPF